MSQKNFIRKNRLFTALAFLVAVGLFFRFFILKSPSTELAQKVLLQIEEHQKNLNLDPSPAGPAYIVLRENGRRLGSQWQTQGKWKSSVARGIDKILQKNPEIAKRVNQIEICLPHSYQNVSPKNRDWGSWNVYRGVRGIEFHSSLSVERICPTEMIAQNQSFKDVADAFAKNTNIPKKEMTQKEVKVRLFDAHQIILFLTPPHSIQIEKMFRGNQIVLPSEVTRKNIQDLADRLGQWLVHHVHENGRMTYKYFPSWEKESQGNNMIRQFMATVCLIRLGKFKNDNYILDLAKKNLQYNFNHFYQTTGNLGHITYMEKTKLGSSALAALAITEAPFHEKFSREKNHLIRFVDHMWQKDGSFRTFFNSERNDVQNFYPGEALVFWAQLYRENKDPKLLSKFMKSFRYYRAWHRNNRNPAFIPWHTQAYYSVWQKVPNPELRDFIFEMNDWLILTMQQWDFLPYDDLKGRFFSPSKPYGPPHASSTGVYLEGLIDAYQLAKKVGDQKRKESYRLAIARALRSVMQLEFKDEVDMFYISDKKQVQGGIRTTVYDNTIRVDNVQHILMGVLKILAEFSPEDFTLHNSPNTID